MDANKGIINISYNHLNLPSQVTFAADKYIDYIYDASGIKLKKIVTNQTAITKTSYAGNYIYGGNALQFFNHAEGYVEPDGSNAYNYIYQYKDHLGNIRLSYTDISTTSTPNLEIVEENNYYPFGLKHKGFNNNITSTNLALKNKYNGKEFEESLGLNNYEMDFRQYDPSIGRFSSVDRLSEFMHDLTPYRFAFNNPILWSDPTGLFESRKEARKYRRENKNVNGSIKKQKDGTFAIINKKSGAYYQSGDDSYYASSDNNPNDGVVQSAFAVGKSKKNNSGMDIRNSEFMRITGNILSSSNTERVANTWSVAGVIGSSKLNSGKYVQLNGNIGNFNKVNSQWANVNKTFAKNLSKVGKGANVLTVAVLAYDVMDDGNIKTSTAINTGLTALAVFVPVTAPFIMTYMVLDMAFDFSGMIDKNSGGINTGLYD